MHVIVCHECFSLTTFLSESIQKYFDAQVEPIDVEPCTELKEVNRLLSPETVMLILSVALGDKDGLCIAKSIRKDYPLLPIIYLTNNHNVDIYDLCNTQPFGLVNSSQSLAFVTRDMLALVRKWYELIYEAPRIFFHYKSGGQAQFLRLKNVIYFEKNGHQMIPKTLIGTAPSFYCSMCALERTLKRTSFIKISQSIMINIKHLVALEKSYCFMSDGSCFNVSRAFRKNVVDIISRYAKISTA